MTNLEKIRNMTAKEMAELLKSIAFCGSYSCKECKARFICRPSEYCLVKIEEIVKVLNEEVKETP